MNKVTCSSCGTSYRVKPEAAGRKVRCKQCGHAIPVPATSASSESQADASHDRAGLDALAPPDESTTPTMAPATAPRPRQRQQRVKVRTGPPAWLMPVAIGGGVAALIGVIALVFVLAWPEGSLSSGIGGAGHASAPDAAPDGLTREFVEQDGFALRLPAGWERKSYGWEGAGRGTMRIEVDEYAWPDDKPLASSMEGRWGGFEPELIDTLEVNGIEMQRYGGDRPRSSGVPMEIEVYLFKVGERRAAISCFRRWPRRLDQQPLVLMRRAVRTVVRRTEPRLAPTPADDAALSDFSQAPPGRLRDRLPLAGASVAVPTEYESRDTLVSAHRQLARMTINPEGSYGLTVHFEGGKGEGRWPNILKAGPTVAAPDAVPAFNDTVTFGRLGGVPFARLTGSNEVRYVGHLDGDRYTLRFSRSRRSPERTGCPTRWRARFGRCRPPTRRQTTRRFSPCHCPPPAG